MTNELLFYSQTRRVLPQERKLIWQKSLDLVGGDRFYLVRHQRKGIFRIWFLHFGFCNAIFRAQDDQNPVPLLFIKIFRNWFLFLNKPDGDFRLRWQLSATHQ